MKSYAMLGAIALAAVAGLGTTALATTDGRVTYLGNYVGNEAGWGGGEMSFNTVFWNGAATGATNPGAFNSFCLETGEHIGGGTYYATVNSSVIAGVSNANGAHSTLENTTAWLYTQFRAGTLSGYTGTNTQQGALQIAIWHAQSQLNNDVGGTGANDNSHWNSLVGAQGTLAHTYFSWAQTAVAGGWTNGNVRVLNLYNNDAATSNVQSFLTLIPLPSASGLAGFGLLAVSVRRRRPASI